MGIHLNLDKPNNNDSDDPSPSSSTANADFTQSKQEESSSLFKDNYNLSPGMDAIIFWRDESSGDIRVDRKVWGLVPRGGSPTKPLPSDPKERIAMHFSNLMYNARSDTLYSKPTFSKLALQGKTCVVAFQGYFEWKPSPVPGDKGKKQPYFVKAASDEFLLMAGLWTKVTTGLQQDPFLDTFTILTTEAHEQIRWLHHRMPMCIWDMTLAQKWLREPSKTLHDELDAASHKVDNPFAWHKVTTSMGSVKFRGKEAIEPIKEMKSVASFFQVKPSPSKDSSNNDAPLKRSIDEESSSTNPSASESISKKKKLSSVAGFSAPVDNAGGTASSQTSPTASNTTSTEHKPKTSSAKKKGPLDSFFSKAK